MSASSGRLLFDAPARAAALREAFDAVDRYARGVAEGGVLPALSLAEARALAASFDFARPLAPADALARALDGLGRGQVHVAHPRYFGLFNPAPTTMGVVADALASAYNPQLATRSHAPFAVEAERHVLRAFGARVGLPDGRVEGVFTSGGAEANLTALLAALGAAFPAVRARGVRALPGDPVLYASAEAHASLVKAARVAGLGDEAVRHVAVDGAGRLRLAALASALAADRARGAAPFLVVATFGTTSGGALDPVSAVADLCAREGLWLHVDAAYGGMLALIPEHEGITRPLARADSLTLDAHKALGVPLTAGMYLSSRVGALAATFGVRAGYMPRDASEDPYAASLAWSRRFVGLKVLLTLAVAGWEGYAEALAGLVARGDRLRVGLRASGWEIRNETPLPVVCFTDGVRPDGRSGLYLGAVARRLAARAEGWLSTTRLASGARVLRACVTSFATTNDDVDGLVAALAAARRDAPT